MIKYIKRPMHDPMLRANVFVGLADEYGYTGLLGYQTDTKDDYAHFLYEFNKPVLELIDVEHSASLTRLLNSLGVGGTAQIGNYALHDDTIIWTPQFSYRNDVKMLGPSPEDQRLPLARVTDGHISKINTSPETSTFHRLMPEGTDHWGRLYDKLTRST